MRLRCGHVTRHNRLEKTIMQGIVAGKWSRGKPIQRRDIADIVGTSRMAHPTGNIMYSGGGRGIDFAKTFGQRHPKEDNLCSQKKNVSTCRRFVHNLYRNGRTSGHKAGTTWQSTGQLRFALVLRVFCL